MQNAGKLKTTEISVEGDADSTFLNEIKNCAVIVDNMQQALFSVGSDGIIIEPITKFTEEVFGLNLLGKNVMQTLFKNLEEKKEDFDAIKSALTTVIGEHELQWDLLKSSFPKKISYNLPGAANSVENLKQFKINISPVWDAEENLERLLFVIEDITNLEKLEAQSKQDQEQVGMIECVLENSLDNLIAAIKTFKDTLKINREISKAIDPISFVDLTRNLHTMKGNARQLKMRILSDQIHKSESIILESMSDIIQSDDATLIFLEMDQIENVLDAHSMLIQKFSRSDMNWGEGVIPVCPLAIQQSWATLEKMKEKVPAAIFEELHWAATRLTFKSVSSIAEKFQSMIKDISLQLGKKVNFEIKNDALVGPNQAFAVQGCLLHLIRNSIDHGIEAPEQRLLQGKSEYGQIIIHCVDHIDSYSIHFSDDGQGIDGDKVLDKALKQKLVTLEQAEAMTLNEKKNLIFLPHFSTKDAASDISGRGIGLDVVQQMVRRLSGTLILTTESGQGFSVEMTFHHQIQNTALKKSA